VEGPEKDPVPLIPRDSVPEWVMEEREPPDLGSSEKKTAIKWR